MLCGMVSIAPCVSAILAAFAATETSVRVMSAGLLLVIVSNFSMFLVCARSLVNAIDKSLERKMEDQVEKGGAGPGGDDGKAGDANLLAARKKIKNVMIVGTTISSTVLSTLSLAILTKWGVAAPLLLFGIPLGK